MVAVRSMIDNRMGFSLVRGCWRHSLACAMLSAEIARAGFLDVNMAYLGGLLHDIGRLALLTLYPREYADLLGVLEGTPLEMLEAEREIFRIDHCEAGVWLVAEWRLPEDLRDIILLHTEAPATGKFDLSAAVRAAGMLANCLGFDVLPDQFGPYDKVMAQIPPGERERLRWDAESLKLTIAAAINSIELR
jgi:putative nucleotidyltransferase with HDIG domain